MLTRKDLRDMGITDEEQITAIINRHKGEIEDLKEAHKTAKPVDSKPADPTPAEKKTAPKGDAPDELEKLRRELAAEKQKIADRERKDAIMAALAALRTALDEHSYLCCGQAIARALLSENEKRRFFVRFNVEGLLRGDYQSRMQGYSIGRQNGWMSANDIRELEALDRIPAEDGGDLYLVNGNMTKLADAGIFARGATTNERDESE